MFCNPFYCPYAEYTLKDREAFGSLLSSADKKKKQTKNSSPDAMQFLQSVVWIFFP